MDSFVEIPGSFLSAIATDSERIPKLYYCGNGFSSRVFWQRLRWIHRLAAELADLERACLDFGAGGGVFLPSLARLFRQVVSIDLETAEASKVVDHYGLANVKLTRGDVTDVELEDAPFGTIVAADVLEHFHELGPPVAALRRLLAEDGVLLTSLPTESWLYAGIRRAYGGRRPPDHYHTGYQVERFLERNGFCRVKRWFVPFRLPIAPLYLVSAWRLDANGAEASR